VSANQFLLNPEGHSSSTMFIKCGCGKDASVPLRHTNGGCVMQLTWVLQNGFGSVDQLDEQTPVISVELTWTT